VRQQSKTKLTALHFWGGVFGEVVRKAQTCSTIEMQGMVEGVQMRIKNRRWLRVVSML